MMIKIFCSISLASKYAASSIWHTLLWLSSRLVGRYIGTVICMHTSYIFCIPLKSKTAQEVAQAYLHHVYSKFGGSEKILSDNGTEFKNKLFKEVASQLGVEYKVYTPPNRPQCIGKIEGFHKYLKSCIANTSSTTWNGTNSLI